MTKKIIEALDRLTDAIFAYKLEKKSKKKTTFKPANSKKSK